MYCVYFLRCPHTKVVKYVGITGGDPSHRFSHHVSCGRNLCVGSNRKDRWVGSLLEDGLHPLMDVVLTGLSKQQALRAESFLIRMNYKHQNDILQANVKSRFETLKNDDMKFFILEFYQAALEASQSPKLVAAAKKLEFIGFPKIAH